MKVEIDTDKDCKPCKLTACIAEELNLPKDKVRELAKMQVSGDVDGIIAFLDKLSEREKVLEALSKCGIK